MNNSRNSLNISIIGGTGALGSGLALRWAQVGHRVTVGSRDGERAAQRAEELSKRAGKIIQGCENTEASKRGDIIVLTVPFANHASTLDMIKPNVSEKIVVDVTVPLRPPKVRTVQLPAEGAVAKITQMTLGETVKVVSAFQNVAAAHLAELGHEIDCDVLVCGNDVDAREQVIGLAEDASMRAWHAGRIDNSAVAEALTSVLIFINGHYNIPGAGIRISGKTDS